jgi:hypothetical protein
MLKNAVMFLTNVRETRGSHKKNKIHKPTRIVHTEDFSNQTLSIHRLLTKTLLNG